MDLGISLLDLEYPNLEELLVGWGQPAYRARQLWRWLYVHLVADPQAMTNLPATLRDRLVGEVILDPLRSVKELASSDALTQKALLALPDGNTLETVLMHYDLHRHTACISSQVGCAIGCSFCATGQGGLVRNLGVGEIVGQVLFWARRLAPLRQRVSNVVFMGMGEPLANYEATWSAVMRLTDEAGLSLGARHITLSTAGLVPGIYRLAAERTQVRLAVSLHAPTDELRDQLVPLNRRYGLAQLMDACRVYQERTERRISFEYVLIQDLNDSPKQAELLAQLLRGLRAHVNLIPLNPVSGFRHRSSSTGRISAFLDVLGQNALPYTLRQSRGAEIQAGCGQLRARQPGRSS